MFKIVVFCSNRDTFLKICENLIKLGILYEDIIFADSGFKNREQIIAENRRQWLLFVDHDCELTEEVLNIAKKFSHAAFENSKSQRSQVVAGLYKNRLGSNIFQLAHNFIANTWVRQSYKYQGQPPLMLGGIFMVFCSLETWEADISIRWGAEDKLMAYHLRDAGFDFMLCEELQVYHSTNPSLKHFLRRAFLHGINDVMLIPKNENQFKISYWLREIGFANWPLVPLILLHFCIQKVAKLIQTVRQMNK